MRDSGLVHALLCFPTGKKMVGVSSRLREGGFSAERAHLNVHGQCRKIKLATASVVLVREGVRPINIRAATDESEYSQNTGRKPTQHFLSGVVYFLT
jgi:hypothetical protein